MQIISGPSATELRHLILESCPSHVHLRSSQGSVGPLSQRNIPILYWKSGRRLRRLGKDPQLSEDFQWKPQSYISIHQCNPKDVGPGTLQSEYWPFRTFQILKFPYGHNAARPFSSRRAPAQTPSAPASLPQPRLTSLFVSKAPKANQTGGWKSTPEKTYTNMRYVHGVHVHAGARCGYG